MWPILVLNQFLSCVGFFHYMNGTPFLFLYYKNYHRFSNPNVKVSQTLLPNAKIPLRELFVRRVGFEPT